MVKRNTTLCIDEGLIANLKTKEVNISKLVNDFLDRYCKIEKEKFNERKVEQEIQETEAKIMSMKNKLEEMNKFKKDRQKQIDKGERLVF